MKGFADMVRMNRTLRYGRCEPTSLAGLRLRGRFGGWSDEPFTAVSRSHVSVWEAS